MFELHRHQIATVGIAADRHSLGLDLAQAIDIAGTHVGIEGTLVLARHAIARLPPDAIDRGPRLAQRQIIEPPMLRIQRRG